MKTTKLHHNEHPIKNARYVVIAIRFIHHYRFLNKAFKIMLPIFRSAPALEVGTPVSLAIRCLICVIPSARFNEKLSPGMGDDFLLITTMLSQL